MSFVVNQLNFEDTKQPLNFVAKFDLNLALRDFINGITNYKFWLTMSIAEIRRRYKRTLIGPFWASLSLGIFILCIGSMLNLIWHTSAKEFLPYFCSGYIAWVLIQSIIAEACNNFTGVTGYIRQVPLPFTIYSCMLSCRNIIVFFHHLVIFLLVIGYARIGLNLNVLLLIPALALVFFTGTWVGILLGMVCARYRDIQQIILSVLQLGMYATPIMWQIEQLGGKALWATYLNPLYHFVSIIRQPLLGQAPSALNWQFTIIFSAIGAAITLLLFAKNYRKIIFWI